MRGGVSGRARATRSARGLRGGRLQPARSGTDAQAEAFAAHLRRKRRGEGRAVYFRESPLRDGWAEEDTEEADWEVDVHVEELELVG